MASTATVAQLVAQRIAGTAASGSSEQRNYNSTSNGNSPKPRRRFATCLLGGGIASMFVLWPEFFFLACDLRLNQSLVGEGKGGSVRACRLLGETYGLCGFAHAFLPRSVSNHLIQAQRDRAQMALKSRSHEILMAEMAVLVKRYRRERGRLYEVNRTLLQQLAELDAQVRVYCRRSTVLVSRFVRVYSRFRFR